MSGRESDNQDFDRRELDWLDGEQDAMIARVREWSAINSGSRNLQGLERMGEVARDAFAELGASYERLDAATAKEVDERGDIREVSFGPVHRFVKHPGANRRVLLTGHLDTVFGPDHAFQDSKFLDDGTLNGPGIADMKGGILVMLQALTALERSPYAGKLGWEVILNSDEEIGSKGSMSHLLSAALGADFGMTFEPALADGTLAGERKGSGNFSAVFRGVAAHAGRDFDQGRNAIAVMARFTTALNELNGAARNAGMAGITVNPAIVTGGAATNVVPDLAMLQFNIRVGTPVEQTWIEGELDQLTSALDGYDGVGVALHGLFTRPPKVLSPANLQLFEALKEAGAELGVDVAWKATGGCCDGNNLAAAGLPNIDTLGVRGGKIHSADEFACVDSFVERAKLSALLLIRYASGSFSLKEKVAS